MTLSEHLERARALARQQGHGRITAAHLLASLSNAPDVQQRIADLGIAMARLDLFVRNALIAEPNVHREPTLDAPLEPLLATTVMELALFDALVAPLAAEIAFDETPLRRFADEVEAATLASGHGRALVEHALYALGRRATDDGRFAAALARLGHNRRDFRHVMAGRIASVERSGPVPSFPELRHRAITHANAKLSEVLGIEAIVVDLLRMSKTRQALESVGVPPAALLFSYVHGGVAARIPRPTGPAELVFFADDFTPPDVLVDLLVRRFGFSPADATTLVQATFAEGRAAVRVADGGLAADAVAATFAEAAQLGMPLRIELRLPPTSLHD